MCVCWDASAPQDAASCEPTWDFRETESFCLLSLSPPVPILAVYTSISESFIVPVILYGS